MLNEKDMRLLMDASELALKTFGPEIQLDQAQEEAAELIAATSHFRRGRDPEAEELEEETCDMLIMIAQVTKILEHMGKDWRSTLARKIARLDTRISNINARGQECQL